MSEHLVIGYLRQELDSENEVSKRYEIVDSKRALPFASIHTRNSDCTRMIFHKLIYTQSKKEKSLIELLGSKLNALNNKPSFEVLTFNFFKAHCNFFVIHSITIKFTQFNLQPSICSFA